MNCNALDMCTEYVQTDEYVHAYTDVGMYVCMYMWSVHHKHKNLSMVVDNKVPCFISFNKFSTATTLSRLPPPLPSLPPHNAELLLYTLIAFIVYVLDACPSTDTLRSMHLKRVYQEYEEAHTWAGKQHTSFAFNYCSYCGRVNRG